jgi:hypothetical protein
LDKGCLTLVRVKSKCKKKVYTIFGQVELKKGHLLQHSKFKITVFVQSIICLLSQQSVFAEASSVLKKMLNLDISAKQFQNVSEFYGSQLDP